MKRRGQDLRRNEEVVESLDSVLANGDDIAWEWPASAHAGWNSKAIKKLIKKMRHYKRQIFWCRFDGCSYGLQWRGLPLRKGWQVLTSSRELWMSLCRRCDGSHQHAECRGHAAQASAYYPPAMCRAVVKAFEHAWSSDINSLEKMAERLLLKYEDEDHSTSSRTLTSSSPLTTASPTTCCDGDGGEPMVLALSRKKLSLEVAPTGKKLEEIKQTMLRVHRAAGHTGMSSLAQLLRAKGAPGWALEIAQNLRCPECTEASKPRPHPPASTGEEPKVFEYLGTDVFEFEEPAPSNPTGDEKIKHKLIIFRDRASGLTMFEHMANYSNAWEPKTSDIVASLSNWLATYPAPKWLVADSARYYTSQEMQDFVSRSGIGLTIAPAEAHWMMGSEEAAIGVGKRTVERLMREGSKLSVPILFKLAASAMNGHVGGTGFSAYQWVFGHGGGTLDDEQLLPGISPHKAFDGLAKARERAKLAFEKERASERFSKLSNAVGRPVNHRYHSGQLVMLWRQRVRPGKVKGMWTGPLRLIVQEGSTLWLASGATLIRAKVNQVRPTTQPEQLKAQLEGTAIYRTPVSVESLMKMFQGRYYQDVSGDVPSERQQADDVSPTTVLQQPTSQADSWSIVERDGKRILIRHHGLPRLALFNPLKVTTCPVSVDELKGTRTTFLKVIATGEKVTIKDTVEENKTLQDRWTGETHFELKETINRPAKVRRSVPKTKRKAEEEPPRDGGPDEHQPGQDQQVPNDGGGAASLHQALQHGGPDRLDGLPARSSASAGSNLCSAPECVLPGGHRGHHQDSGGTQFMYDNYDGRSSPVENADNKIDDGESSSTSSASSSHGDSVESEELIQDGDLPEADAHYAETKPKDTFVAIELDIGEEDFAWLSKYHSKKRGTVWLSKKMAERGRELSWNQLTLDQKKEFDLAQAKEISNVIVSKALRNLTPKELEKLNPGAVMSMRWVLTRKASGDAKARLVVLGFQAHNLTEVETTAPTMGKGAKNALLALTAALKFTLKSGDVTSAFLQTDTSLEDEGLTVWAPPELARAFGAEPGDPRALRVVQAFYGLAHAPRKWFERCQRTLLEHGWRQMKADRCLYALFVERNGVTTLIGLAGIHVDDFLLSGDGSPEFLEAESKLQSAFRWGKWDQDEFDFAGTHIVQHSDKSITMNQKDYTERWIEEVSIDPNRSRKSPLTPSEVTALRGVLGTISWRSTQTAPEYLAETSLLLSEIGKATIETLHKANKLVREMRRRAAQGLLFPTWDTKDFAVVTWTDASQGNRPDRSSTVGILSALAPADVLWGEERQFSVLQWKSGKAPRQSLGSNGSEVQGLTLGEDMNFQLRALIAEMLGAVPERGHLNEHAKKVKGALVLDSRGIYDTATRNLSGLHGPRDSRCGYELTLAVNRAYQIGTQFRWVNGLAQLADALTKVNAIKVMLQFYQQRQMWRLIHDEKFESGRKVHKRMMLKQLEEHHITFLNLVKKLAKDNGYPWDEKENYEEFHPLS